MSSIGSFNKGQTQTDRTRVGQSGTSDPYLDLAYKAGSQLDKANAYQNLFMGGPGYLGSFSGEQGARTPPPVVPPGPRPDPVGPDGGNPRFNPDGTRIIKKYGTAGNEPGPTVPTEPQINPFTGLPMGQWGAKSQYPISPRLGQDPLAPEKPFVPPNFGPFIGNDVKTPDNPNPQPPPVGPPAVPADPVISPVFPPPGPPPGPPGGQGEDPRDRKPPKMGLSPDDLLRQLFG